MRKEEFIRIKSQLDIHECLLKLLNNKTLEIGASIQENELKIRCLKNCSTTFNLQDRSCCLKR